MIESPTSRSISRKEKENKKKDGYWRNYSFVRTNSGKRCRRKNDKRPKKRTELGNKKINTRDEVHRPGSKLAEKSAVGERESSSHAPYGSPKGNGKEGKPSNRFSRWGRKKKKSPTKQQEIKNQDAGADLREALGVAISGPGRKVTHRHEIARKPESKNKLHRW